MLDLNAIRQRILRGEHPTAEELRAAIEQLRAERTAKTEKSVEKRIKSGKLSDAEIMSSLDDALAAITPKEPSK